MSYITYKQDADKPYVKWIIKEWDNLSAIFSGYFMLRKTASQIELMILLYSKEDTQGIGGIDKLKEDQVIYWVIPENKNENDKMAFLQNLWIRDLSTLAANNSKDAIYLGEFYVGASQVELKKLQRLEKPTIFDKFLELLSVSEPGTEGYNELRKMFPEWPEIKSSGFGNGGGKSSVNEIEKFNQRTNWLREQLAPIIGEDSMKSGVISGIALELAKAKTNDKEKADAIENALRICAVIIK